ncbi:transcription elongation factor Spt5 [Paxillus ammoniavirescens]|nr:transcription elongation factor Spt5 [Paxillus ammoniavirescens]
MDEDYSMSDPIQAENEEEEVEETQPERKSGKSRGSIYDALDDEDDEEDEDEDEDEEEDEEEGGRHGKKRAKHRHKRAAVNRFLDVEAEVDTEEEEEEEEEEVGGDEFIADAGLEGDEDDMNRRAAVNARLDRRERELNDQDLAKIAQNLHERYGRAAVRYTGDMNEVPQRLLMPSVHDASLWQVRVKPGRERDIVFSLMRKAIDLEYTAQPLSVLSAFQRDSLAGMIYVESRSAQQVNQACKGLVGVYPSRGITLVPIEEMASLLQIKKQDLTVTPGTWVRIKRGKYQGDLAQVMDITENGEDVGLKFIPRIDLNPRDDANVDGRKRKKAASGVSTMRPPQRFFNYEEVVKVYGRKQVSKRNQVYVFQNDTYKDGFIEKDFKLSALQLDDVNPTLDEITRFTRGQDGAEHENAVDLSIIAEASRKAAITVLQPGDHVEVFEGEQAGVHGVVDSINQDVVTITAVGVDIDGQKVDVPARSVRKRFKAGDHVKVMAGQNADETGLVVCVSDNVVTFLSDMSMQEVSVFSKDLREAAEVGSGTNIVGNYELHDLVQLDLQTVGVIFKTERDSFRVLDQNGQVRLVQPHQISMRRDSNRAIATDSEGHELRVNDNVREVDGEGRKGRVLHYYQSFFAFLHNRDISENGGVFVTRARSLASLAPKGNLVKPGTDLGKMNPHAAGGAPMGGMVGSAMGRGPRDRDIGALVAIVKGPQKGYLGIIKDTNGNFARVELHTGNKVITIDKEKLYRKLPDGSLVPLSQPYNPNWGQGGFRTPGAPARTPNPFAQANGGRTPGWSSGRTPNPYASGDGKTPAWNASSRTPNPFSAEGSKTPAWNAASRTPNPYQEGGKTPAWNAGSRTPNPYQDGGKTPAWGASRTPNSYGSDNDRSGWGGGWGGGASETTWGNSSPVRPAETSDWTAQTPAVAPTPYSALTPYTSAPTPRTMGSGGAGERSAPTPGVSGEDEDDSTPAWLLDPLFQGKKLLMEITGTLGSWHGGELDGAKGFVSNAFRTLGDALITIEHIDPGRVGTSVDVPIMYLTPISPDQVGDHAILLEGSSRATEVILRQLVTSGVWEVSKLSDSKTFTCLEDKMVKLYIS